MKNKILNRVLISVLTLAALGLIAIYIISVRYGRYDGKYIYTDDENTVIIEVQEKKDTLKIKYILSSCTVSSEPNYEDLTSSVVSFSEFNYKAAYYAEYDFEIPIDKIAGGVQVGVYDKYRQCYKYAGMFFASDGIYVSKEFNYADDADLIYPAGTVSTLNDEIDINNEPGSWDNIEGYWLYAARTGYDTEHIAAAIKCILAAVVVVFGIALSLCYVRRTGKTKQYIALAVVMVYCAAAYFIFLMPSCAGTYAAKDDGMIMTGEETAEVIDYGDTAVLMIGQNVYDIEPEESYDAIIDETDIDMDEEAVVPKIYYTPIIFSDYNGKWYNIDGINVKSIMNERVTVNSVCSLKQTFEGIGLVFDDDVRGIDVRCDFQRQGIYSISENLRYVILLPAAFMTVIVIAGVIGRRRYLRLNPQYPYGQYVMKKLVYINPDMEYMRKYLINNLREAKVLWKQNTFAVNDSEFVSPVYARDDSKDRLSGIFGMKRSVDITVNKLKGRADSYRLAYNAKKTVLATVIDDKIVAAFELEVCNE